MRLSQLKIKHFRGYENETVLNFSDTGITSIIGRNDIGKSTLLEALEIFFNNKTVKIEQDDLNISSAGQPVEITCVFDQLPTELTIDAGSQTSLQQEYLLNADGKLEIVKKYNCSLKTPKESVFAKAHHPNVAQLADLLLLKQAELKKRAGELNIDLNNVDQRSNVEMRQAIRNSIPEEQWNSSLLEIDLSKEDAKRIWERLSSELPVFALFQSDRKSHDDDNEVQDPMKAAVQEALKTVQAEMDSIKAKVEAFALDVASRTLGKLKEMSPELAADLKPRFKAEPKYDGFKLSLTGEDDIPINKRGSGVRRLILLNFFRAEAERRQAQENAPGVIYAIEEPENSQHPSNQRMLMKALKELSDKDGCQVIVTTHVPAVAGLLPEESIRYISKGENSHPIIKEHDDQLLGTVAQELGILPDKRVKVIVCLEGPTDIDFLEHTSSLINANDNTIVSLRDCAEVAMISLGGGTLKQWVNKHYLRNLEIPEVHIYDRDMDTPPKYEDSVNEVNARGDGSWATLTGKREIENYIHPDAIQEITGFEITYGDEDDVAEILAEQTHSSAQDSQPWTELSREQKKKKIKAAKRKLCGSILSAMTIERLIQQDANEDVKGWLREISARLQ